MNGPLLDRGDVVLDPGKVLRCVEPPGQVGGIGPGEHRGQLHRRLIDVRNPARIGIDRRYAKVGRQQLAIAVDDVGATGIGADFLCRRRHGGDRLVAGTHIDQPNADTDKGDGEAAGEDAQPPAAQRQCRSKRPAGRHPEVHRDGTLQLPRSTIGFARSAPSAPRRQHDHQRIARQLDLRAAADRRQLDELPRAGRTQMELIGLPDQAVGPGQIGEVGLPQPQLPALLLDLTLDVGEFPLTSTTAYLRRKTPAATRNDRAAARRRCNAARHAAALHRPLARPTIRLADDAAPRAGAPIGPADWPRSRGRWRVRFHRTGHRHLASVDATGGKWRDPP